MSDFSALSEALGGGALADVRSLGRRRLGETGLPGRKSEDWKYTSTRSILSTDFSSEGTPSLPAGPWDGASRAVFVQGRFVPELSQLPEGVRRLADDASGVGDLLGEPSGFDAVNAALLCDGLTLQVQGAVAEPLHIVHLNGGGASALRVVIQAEAGSSVRVMEHILGDGEGLTSSVTEMRLGGQAEVHHQKVQDVGGGFHVGTLVAELGPQATLVAHSIALGGKVARTEFRARLGEGARCDLVGLTLASKDHVVDHHITVDHASPDSLSSQRFRAVLADTSRGVFTGKVIVRQDAQRIDSSQQNNTLLLSDEAVANSRPQLEIYADDVKCAHGATVGQIDPEAEFYLRSRGLSASEARAILTFAFANELLNTLPDDDLRSWLQDRVRVGLEAL
jgi:Fe-S cluster assembly protein SufD